MNRNTTPHPSQLLRISDFYAELPPGPLAEDTPGWLRSYLTDGTIDYGSGQRPVAGPAEALDIVRRKAAERGLGPRFNTRMLVAVRLPVGYRVFMYQPPDTPFDQLIVGSPRFYVGDDCRIYPTRAAPGTFRRRVPRRLRTASWLRLHHRRPVGSARRDHRPPKAGLR